MKRRTTILTCIIISFVGIIAYLGYKHISKLPVIRVGKYGIMLKQPKLMIRLREVDKKYKNSFGFQKPDSLSETQTRRVNELEEFGCVPEKWQKDDGTLAQYTSWWGKPLDPEEFWKGEVIWITDKMVYKAHRYGRKYPPLPTHIINSTNFIGSGNDTYSYNPKISSKLRVFPNYISNTKEFNFWDNFARKMLPIPPNQIEERQFEVAASMLSENNFLPTKSEYIDKNIGSSLKRRNISQARIAVNMKKDRLLNQKESIELGFPPEPFQDYDSLLYCYVKRQRAEYKKAVMNNNEWKKNNIISRLMVDKSYITNNLDPEFVKRGTAWQTNYLTRLRNEGWDESYIEAYKKAWDVKNFE